MVLLDPKSSNQWIIVHPSFSEWKSLNKFLHNELKREEASFCSWYGLLLVIPDITQGRWWWQMLTFWQCHWLQELSHHLPKVKNGRLCCWLKYRLEMQHPSQSFFLSFWTWVLYDCHHKPTAQESWETNSSILALSKALLKWTPFMDLRTSRNYWIFFFKF